MTNPAKQNLALLQQGIDVFEEVPGFIYIGVRPEYFGGSIGKHVRHIVNFYESFLGGLETGRIDYDARIRDARVEAQVDVAIDRLRTLLHILSGLDPSRKEEPVWVHQNEGEEEIGQPQEWCRSTIGRELQALVSHTVHHYAIIALILRIYGIDCPEDFGVAPSTLKYQRSLECAPCPG